jgi:hypothetical protein
MHVPAYAMPKGADGLSHVQNFVFSVGISEFAQPVDKTENLQIKLIGFLLLLGAPDAHSHYVLLARALRMNASLAFWICFVLAWLRLASFSAASK